jgi:hypothetical protein
MKSASFTEVRGGISVLLLFHAGGAKDGWQGQASLFGFPEHPRTLAKRQESTGYREILRLTEREKL